jgi:hypothetical protein
LAIREYVARELSECYEWNTIHSSELSLKERLRGDLNRFCSVTSMHLTTESGEVAVVSGSEEII